MQDSLVNYTQMIVDSCWQVVDLKEDFIWPENDLINSYIKYINTDIVVNISKFKFFFLWKT